MFRAAVIEDDKDVNDVLKTWIEKAKPGAKVDQWFTRDDALKAVTTERYELLSLDIDMSGDKNAGLTIISRALRIAPVPVLVVSGLPDIRGPMLALDAWDVLAKPVSEQDYIATLLQILRLAERQRDDSTEHLQLDPIRLAKPMWKGKRVRLPATAQRILNAIYEKRKAQDPTVTYDELFQVIASGKNKDNIRKQISNIKREFRDVDADFDCIVAEPMRGYRWVSR